MKNKNFIKIKRVNEERYFTCIYDVYRFIEKMTHTTIESMCDRFHTDKRLYNCYERDILIPMAEIQQTNNVFITFSGFVFALSKGVFVRKSGTYKYNILSIERK